MGMTRVALVVLALVEQACGLRAMGFSAASQQAVVSRRSAPAVMAYGNLPNDALVKRGKATGDIFRNFMQMADQRVAHVSQILLAPGKCTLPLNEAQALMESWKQEIGTDAEAFAAKAEVESHCPTGKRDRGDLGYITRGKCCEEFDDIIFKEEPGNTYGPITTAAGVALIYLHSCREPKPMSQKEKEAA